MRTSSRVPAIAVAVASLLLSIGLLPIESVGAGAAAQGCMKQWMFNGLWRVQVTGVAPLMDGGTQVGWQVTEVWRNGTTQTLSPGATTLKPQSLALANGTTISTDATTKGALSESGLDAHDFAQSAQLTFVVNFRAPGAFDPSVKPKAVDIVFDAAAESQMRFKPQFSTSTPNYHIKLDCTATGSAANAAGGSQELAAQSGCLNQWMSNGVWRMRATLIGPDSPNGQQIGWAVTEQWTNQSKQTIAPGETWVGDQQLVFANGDTLSSTNSAGSSMAQAKLMTNEFAPGGALTFQELFRPDSFDNSQTPVKLLVTFNAESENQSSFRPHYSVSPANFRIALTCTK